MAIKKNKKGIKGYVEGGVLLGEDQDPLVKKTTPKSEIKVTPAAAYNPDVFSAEIAKFKSLPVNKKTGLIDLPKGAIRTQVPALTTAVKTTQDYLYDYMKANQKASLTSAEADALLQKANMGTYGDYINQAKNLKAYRDLTVVPAKTLNQSVETGGTYNPVMGGGISMEPTVPFDSTHYEYLFPKNTYVAPQNKAKGGKINGKGIKGYQVGGDIQEQILRAESEKALSRKPKDYIHDVGLGIVDWSLQGIGAQDVIKAEDYNTKQGVDTNRLNSGVGAVGSAVGGAVLDYYVPGLGTAVRGGKKGVGKMAGEDEGISDKDKATMAKIDTAGNIGGGLASMIGGKKKQDDASTTDESVVAPEIADTTTDVAATTATTTAPQQVTSGENLTGQALTDWKSALTGEAKQSVLDKYNAGEYGFAKGGKISVAKAREILHDGKVHGNPITDQQRKFFGAMMSKGKADGGKIIGKGDGTSDSIPAKLQDDGFVVPAMNAKVAQELRAKYLGDSKSKIASLNKGGVPVKVSNGEHYFTKAEKAILESNGVNLDALAPNAEDANELADGGKVKKQEKELAWQKWSNQNWDPTSGQSEREARKLFETEFAKGEKVASTTGAPTTTPVKEKTNPLKRMDVGQGLALAQTGLGLTSLLQDGKRPEDAIDPEFAKTVEEAKGESQYGFTPLQMQIANRGIEKNRAADVQTIINLSGGSAGTALANIRAAGITANEAKNNLTAQSEALRLQKKRYADAKVAEKAGMSKQLFNEKLNAFNVDQEAGAGLLSAGLGNLIGGQRYQSELEAQKKRESMYNPTFNIA